MRSNRTTASSSLPKLSLISAVVAGVLCISAPVSVLAQAHLGVTVPNVDSFTRDQVTTLHRLYSITNSPASDGKRVPQSWTGDYASCNAGTTSTAWQEMMMRQLNVYRSLSDLNIAGLSQGAYVQKAQAAALVNAVNVLANPSWGNALSHNPPASSTCFSQLALDGAQTSQLSSVFIADVSVDALVDDGGPSNYFAGHRQASLHAGVSAFAFGATVWDAAGRRTAVVAVPWGVPQNEIAPPPDTPAFTAWPSPGYFPAQLLPTGSYRWTTGCYGCDMTNATATATANGAPIPLTKELVNPLWNQQLVFKVPAAWQDALAVRGWGAANNWPEYAQVRPNIGDNKVDITVSGAKDKAGRTLPTYTYSVTIYDADANLAAKPLPSQRYSGVWGVANEGWSLNLTQARNGVLVGYWATFDGSGNPIWYQIGDGRWTSTTSFTGKLLRYTAATADQPTVVGGLTIAFSDRQNATFSFDLNGASGTRQITRSMLGLESYQERAHNFSDLWTFNGAGAGGLSITQDFLAARVIFATFDVSGNPVWYRSTVASFSGALTPGNAQTLSARMVRSSGSPPNTTWSAGTATDTDVGSVTLRFTETEAGTASLTTPVATLASTPIARTFTGRWAQGFTTPLSKRGGIDIDGNGRSVLVVRDAAAGEMQAGRFVNDTFQWTPIADPGVNFRILGAVDLANNGKSDLLMMDTSQPGEFGNVFAWRGFNAGNNQLLRQVKKAWDLQAAGDMDGNGPGDLVWRWTGNDADFGVSYIWFIDPNNTTTPVQQVRKRGGAPLSWRLLGAMDVNDDGAADMIYMSPDRNLRVLIATGSAAAPRTCANFMAGSIPNGFSVLAYKDFTGARRGGDVLIRNDSTGELRTITIVANSTPLPEYKGDPNDRNASCSAAGAGAAVIVTQTSMGSVDPAWSYFASGDFNGDGTFDVAWRKPDGTLAVTLFSVNGTPRTVTNTGSVAQRFTPIPLQ